MSATLREREQDADAPVWGSRRLKERVWVWVEVVVEEEGLDWKVRKLVIWKVLDDLSWADWQGDERVATGEPIAFVGKDERRRRGKKEIGTLCMVLIMAGNWEALMIVLLTQLSKGRTENLLRGLRVEIYNGWRFVQNPYVTNAFLKNQRKSCETKSPHHPVEAICLLGQTRIRKRLQAE